MGGLEITFSLNFFSLKRPFIVPQRPLFMLSIVLSVFSYFLAFVLRCSFLFFSFSYYHTRIISLVCSLPLRIHVYFLYK